MTPMTHIYLSNIVLPEHRFVKSPTLVRLKTRVWIQWNPVKFDSKFPGQETCSPTRYQIWEKKISLRRKFSASDGLAEHPDTIVTNVFSVPLPCSYKTPLTPVAGSIFGPLSTRSIDWFHFEECLISRFYFVHNPSNLVSQVLLCARSFRTLNRAISFRRIKIVFSSFWKRDREYVFYKCSKSGQNSFVIENLFQRDYLY